MVKWKDETVPCQNEKMEKCIIIMEKMKWNSAMPKRKTGKLEKSGVYVSVFTFSHFHLGLNGTCPFFIIIFWLSTFHLFIFPLFHFPTFPLLPCTFLFFHFSIFPFGFRCPGGRQFEAPAEGGIL